MNDTLLWELIPLCAVSRPPFRKLNTVTLHACPAERVTLTAVDQSLRAPYMEIEVPYRMYLGFHWSDFPETLFTHSPRLRYEGRKIGCDRSIIMGTLLVL